MKLNLLMVVSEYGWVTVVPILATYLWCTCFTTTTVQHGRDDDEETQGSGLDTDSDITALACDTLRDILTQHNILEQGGVTASVR